MMQRFSILVKHVPSFCILQKDEAMKLVRDGIAAGIFNDLGSGSNIDLCIITKDKLEYLRPYDEANLKGKRSVNQYLGRRSLKYYIWKIWTISFEVSYYIF